MVNYFDCSKNLDSFTLLAIDRNYRTNICGLNTRVTAVVFKSFVNKILSWSICTSLYIGTRGLSGKSNENS